MFSSDGGIFCDRNSLKLQFGSHFPLISSQRNTHHHAQNGRPPVIILVMKECGYHAGNGTTSERRISQVTIGWVEITTRIG